MRLARPNGMARACHIVNVGAGTFAAFSVALCGAGLEQFERWRAAGVTSFVSIAN
jgi:hypothetical protein